MASDPTPSGASGESSLSFEQFLSVRGSFGATFDADRRRLYVLSTLSGVTGLYAVQLDDPTAWPAPLVVGMDRVQYAYPSSRSGRLCLGTDRGGDERTQLWLLDQPGRRPRRLTWDDQAIHHFGSWDAAGQTVYYAGNGRDPRFFDLYAVDVESGETTCLLQQDASLRVAAVDRPAEHLLVQRVHTNFHHDLFELHLRDGSTSLLSAPGERSRYPAGQFSPGGRQVACLTDRGEDFLYLALLDSRSGREERRIQPEGADIEDALLSPDGEWLAYLLNREGYSEARLLHLASDRDEPIECPERSLCYDAGRWSPTLAWSADSSRLALTMTSGTATHDCWVVDRATRLASRATRSWSADLPSEALVEPTLVHYPTFDGRQIPAFLYAPHRVGEAPSQAAVFFVHGGPESQFRPSFNPVISYLVHRGFTVVAPNVRGSTGYGRRYAALDDVELRLDSVRDLAAGAEWLAASGQAHPRRIGVMGGSYGGYMVLAALTERPDLWAAGVDIVGIANFITFLERTGPWRRRQREAEYGSLQHHRALLARLSPINRVDMIRAPLLVVHGANDPRVPISEAEQIVAELEARGRPTELLRFEDEGHGVVKLANRLVAYPRIAEFFERHLRSD